MIAVCISGKIHEDYKQNIKNIQKVFPDPTFFGTWRDSPQPDVSNLFTFDEPKFDYHPMLELPWNPPCNIFKNLVREEGKLRRLNRIEQTQTSAVQILGHHLLVREIPRQYTTIIRLRYDTIVSEKVSFSKYLSMAEKGKVIGFGDFVGSRKSNARIEPSNRLTEYKHQSISRCHYNIWDSMIFHPRHRIESAWHLYQEKRLMGMEWGWFQVLCGSRTDPNYINVNGGVMLNKLKVQMQDISHRFKGKK